MELRGKVIRIDKCDKWALSKDLLLTHTWNRKMCHMKSAFCWSNWNDCKFSSSTGIGERSFKQLTRFWNRIMWINDIKYAPPVLALFSRNNAFRRPLTKMKSSPFFHKFYYSYVHNKEKIVQIMFYKL